MFEVVRQDFPVSKEHMRKRICDFEKILLQQNGSFIGSAHGNKECPVEHFYGDGLYIRKITMPKGMLLTSKIHNKRHPYFVISGDCTVLTDDKIVRIKAPYWGITEPLTKRILYMHDETVWVTVHATKLKNPEDIERKIILPSFDNTITFEEAEKILLEIEK